MQSNVVGIQPCANSQRDFLVLTQTSLVRMKGDDGMTEVKVMTLPGGKKAKVAAGRAVTKGHREAG